jgi:putative ABC transport system substrate-binding protein
MTIKRREFLSLLGGAVAWPLAARAQQAEPVRRVGALLLSAKDSPLTQSAIAAFRERLAMLGWVEGGNLRMDYRFFSGDPDRRVAYAEELVNLRPDLILAVTRPAALTVQQRAPGIPIVFVGGGDPARPGLGWSGRQHSTTQRQYDRIRERFRIAGRQMAGAVQGGRTRLDQGRKCFCGK